jgi:hypothetical protein
MGVQAGIIECPHCGNHLQDTKQETMDCRFCGKRFNRGTIGKEKEEAMRRDMLLDLTDKVQKYKVIILAGKIFGALFLAFTIIFMFAEELTMIEIGLLIAFLVNGFVWLGLASKYSAQLQKDQSKLFDLSGGRQVFEY